LGAGFIFNPLENLTNVRTLKAYDRTLEPKPSDLIAFFAIHPHRSSRIPAAPAAPSQRATLISETASAAA